VALSFLPITELDTYLIIDERTVSRGTHVSQILEFLGGLFVSHTNLGCRLNLSFSKQRCRRLAEQLLSD